MMPPSVAEPMAFYFAGPLREPEVIIVANNEIEAKATFKQLSGKVVTPRKAHPVIIASPDVQEILDVQLQGDSPKGMYETDDEEAFPLLSHFGQRGIRPEWVFDRRTGKVAPAGEFQSIPQILLDLSEKPTVAEVQAAGGKMGSSLDTEVAAINERMPWLQIQDGDDLRERLISECERWERRHLS